MDVPGEKLIIKMWETLADKGLGGFLSPWQIKRTGKANLEVRQQEIIGIAMAEKQADDIKKGLLNSQESLLCLGQVTDVSALPLRKDEIEHTINYDLLDQITKANQRHEQLRRELNTSNAILAAEKELINNNKETPDENVNDDWLYSWRDYASRTSSMELQYLWGRILAGEITTPGAYSLRTLEFLKGLTTYEAKMITDVAKFFVGNGIWRDKTSHFEDSGIGYGHFLTLQELGILKGVEVRTISLSLPSFIPESYVHVLHSNNMAIVITHDDAKKKLTMPIYGLTNVGQEVATLVETEPDLNYLKSVAREIKSKGFSVLLGTWIYTSPTHGDIIDAIDLDEDPSK